MYSLDVVALDVRGNLFECFAVVFVFGHLELIRDCSKVGEYRFNTLIFCENTADPTSELAGSKISKL